MVTVSEMQGGKHVVLPNFPPVTSNCTQFQQKWQMRWHLKHLCNQTTGGKAPETCLPACTSLFWTADPNTLHLLEWHVAAILKGGSSATPLMSTTVSKAGKPFSLLSVFHLDREFSILERDFWSEADKEQIYMV